MSVFQEFEKEAIRLLAKGTVLGPGIEDILTESKLVSLEETGVGYFLTVRHASLPEERHVLDKPLLVGESNGVECGFVVFVEGGELCLECHSWGDGGIPTGFRSEAVGIRIGE